MDKISKSLSKFSFAEKKVVLRVLVALKSNKYQGLDLVKLKNKAYIYRVRKGNIRIIFKKVKSEIKLLTVERRSEKTYKNL